MGAASLAVLVIVCCVVAAQLPEEPQQELLHLDKAPRHELRVLYCRSCGYRQAFEQYEKMLHDKYPGVLKIVGEVHDSSMISLLIARLLGLIKMMLVVVIGSGKWDAMMGWFRRRLRQHFEGTGAAQRRRLSDQPAEANPELQPATGWRRWCNSNRWTACVAIYAGCAAIETACVATGAFEMFLDEMPVWSKLESGRAPQPAELIAIIDSHLAMIRAR
ncbi:putative esophageal gland cell secretory protein 6 [Adelges cooleyi]|uniref:putative esophageal gland cell secretory protein 6 n=1 Tax=Adelges cooleyi TaxID=133065 RepID=UPI0021802E8A|nr:putative esophageal gland cell secretory protein 6 [Adelges cooleyi]